MAILTDELLEQIQYELEGSCTDLASIIENYDLEEEPDELEERLLDGAHPMERSKCCEWWFQAAVLEFEDARNGGVCEQCAPEMHDI